MEKLKKLFGSIELNWKKVIISAIMAGVYTALMCIIPQVQYTSLNTIAVSFEVWIFIGIIIIMNAKSNKDSALKCFVFFLISQPLVYLLQVPFSSQGWNILWYYKRWFMWTILCLPMGYIGYYIKKDKWWGYLILFPMILLTASSYNTYLIRFTFYYPKYLLISLFCATAMIIYPIMLFNNKKIKLIGTLISSLIIISITTLVVLNPYRYSTDLFSEIDNKEITKDYQVSLKDKKYGDVYIDYIEEIESYMIHADFKKNGKTELIVKTPEGKTKKYDLTIEMDTYKLEEK